MTDDEVVVHKYHKIRLLGSPETVHIFDNPEDDIVIEEKIDGSNLRVYMNGDTKIFGSRRVLFKTDDKIDPQMREAVSFLKKKLPATVSYPVVVYGEAKTHRRLKYDYDRMPPFQLFDIYSVELEWYMPLEYIQAKSEEWGIPMVPVVDVVKAGELRKRYIDDDIVPVSAYGDIKAEGVVLKNYKRQIFAKYVRSDLAESKKNRSKPEDNLDNQATLVFIGRHVTKERIEKAIYRLVDDGNPLAMQLMKELPQEVLIDLYEETDLKELKDVNMRLLKKSIAQRCVKVLKEMILSQALRAEGV